MVRGFSGGMMQRLSIPRAMMHDPQVLFLDEPSARLDPQTRILLWEIVREYHREGRTVLLTTHNMEEADALCQRLAVIGATFALPWLVRFVLRRCCSYGQFSSIL